RHVSVGYTVDQWQDSRAGALRVRTAVRWTPKELSLVAVPADPGATVRGEPMDPNTVTTADDGQKRAAVNAEIRTPLTAAGLAHPAADSLIDRGATVDDAKRELFDALLERGTATVRHQRIELGASGDDPAKRLGWMTDALTCRLTGATPPEPARPYMHRRV